MRGASKQHVSKLECDMCDALGIVCGAVNSGMRCGIADGFPHAIGRKTSVIGRYGTDPGKSINCFDGRDRAVCVVMVPNTGTSARATMTT